MPLDDSLPIEGWSKSEASDAEVSISAKATAAAAELAEDSDSHLYAVVFHPCLFFTTFGFLVFRI
jgi:hypothetical protein